MERVRVCGEVFPGSGAAPFFEIRTRSGKLVATVPSVNAENLTERREGAEWMAAQINAGAVLSCAD